jgi:hypothetical protein
MYVEKRLELLMVGAAAPDDLSGTGVHSYSYLVLSPCSVDKLLASVTTILSGAATLELKRRPTFGSATGEVVLDSLVLPDSLAVGQTYQSTFKGVELDVGDELVFEVSVAATSGGALYGVEVDNDPEEPGNNAELSEV